MLNLNVYNFINSKKLLYFLTSTTFFIFAYNIYVYDPLYGYDARDHYYYIDYFAMYLPDKINLPSIEDSKEFFSPPLPYLVPSFVVVFCRNIIESSNYVEDCRPSLALITQIFQTFMFFGTLFIYSKIIKKMYKDINFSHFLLIVLLLTVNYRTFLMIRGEPYIIFFQALCLMIIYNFLLFEKKADVKNFIFLGVLIGLIGLSKQWGFLLFPSYFFLYFYLKNKDIRKNYLKFLILAFFIGFIICGWFYVGLLLDYGSFTAFNKEPTPLRFDNQPLSFYFSFELNDLLFKNPIRPNFDNQLFPILYSDLWGDYWGYFSFILKGWEYGRFQPTVGAYLGRVNLVSIFPTFLLILGTVFSFKKIVKTKKNTQDIFQIFILFSSLITFVGYLWFLIKYPEKPSGDTIKATYVIQMFHLMVFMCFDYLNELKKKNERVYNIIFILLFLIYLHNIPAMVTNYLK